MTQQRPESDRGWLEPESPANDETPPQYPYNNITQTRSGHSFEMDDTPARERIRLQHRTGTFIEMHPNGDEVHKVYGDGYEITIKNKNVLIEGHCNITINGDSILHIRGDKIEKVDGDYKLEVLGEMSTYVHKKTTLATTSDLTIGAGSSLSGGAIRLTSPDNVYVSSDLTVSGDVTAEAILSFGRIDAGTGVSAGPLGFVTLLGGVSVGFPVAVPGNVICTGLMNAGVAVNAPTGNFGVAVNSPLGNFGVMRAGFMTDNVNTKIYSRHFHAAPRGRTGPPIIGMI